MIVTLRDHPKDRSFVIATTPPDLSSLMGKFAPARYDTESKTYLIEPSDVDAFARFLTIHGHKVLDDRRAARTSSDEGMAEPLPECGHCGQPAGRHISARLRRCPDCGFDWEPKIFHAGPARGERISFAEWYANHHDDPDPVVRAGAAELARMYGTPVAGARPLTTGIPEDPWA